MKNDMKYKDLLNQLANLVQAQLNQTVTVYQRSQDEYYPVNKAHFTHADDVLDQNHFYLDIE